jgi:uncharacterized protein (DUF2147 family)
MMFSALVLASTPVLADETGDWLVEDGTAKIRIENCSGALWGFVAWEKSPGGKDTENPDPAKRDRPTLGLPILLNMQPATNSPGRWDGEVYNAQNGKTYTSHIALTNTDTLRIEGCVLGFLCGGQNWTRAAADPAPAAAAAPAPKAGGAKLAAAGPTAPKAAPAPAGAAAPAGAMAKSAAAPSKPAPAKGAAAGSTTKTAAAANADATTSLCSTVPQLPGPAH